VARKISTRVKKDWHPRSEKGSVNLHKLPDDVDLANGETWMLLARNNKMLADWRRVAMDQGVPFRHGKFKSVKQDHLDGILAWERLRQGSAESLHIWKKVTKLIRRRVRLPDGYDTEQYTLEQIGGLTPAIWHEALDNIQDRIREYYVSMLRSGYKLQDEPKVLLSTIHGVKGGEADSVAVMTDMSWLTYEHYYNSPDSEHRVFYVAFTRAIHNLHIIEPQTARFYSLEGLENYF
jgi:ATP-dependent exoDNAse (exonuclease V) beta subunit